jgi:hypothetical protein
MTSRAAQGTRWIARILFPVMLALVAGCATGQRPVQPEPAADWMSPHAPWLGAQPSPLVRLNNPIEARYHMRMHFDDLRMVQRLLVAGKLDDGRSLAYLLTRPTADAGLTRWDEQSRRVSAAARELTRTPNVNEALRQLARVAVECAGCHVAARSTPTFASPPPPADRPTPEARMARHAWAAERLWEAILGADDARWRGGLTVLADAPLPPDVLSDTGKFGRDLQAYARTQLDTHGSPSLETRGIAYGEILVLCAGCHASRY